MGTKELKIYKAAATAYGQHLVQNLGMKNQEVQNSRCLVAYKETQVYGTAVGILYLGGVGVGGVLRRPQSPALGCTWLHHGPQKSPEASSCFWKIIS